MEKKYIKDISQVSETSSGVKVRILSNLKTDLNAVQNIVESCANGSCNCMKPEVKEKVTGMEFIQNDDEAYIQIQGNVSVEEINETMERSQKEINSAECCSIPNESR